MKATEMTSNKPYIVRAFYDWISDNGLTPYILVDANVPGVLVPQAFVNDGQIVLNVSAAAVGGLAMGGGLIEFNARFGGKPEHIVVPYGAIGAIYAKENGAGTSLPIEMPDTSASIDSDEAGESPASLKPVSQSDNKEAKPVTPNKKGKPSLKVVK